MATTPVTRSIGGQHRTRQSGLRMPHERDESSAHAADSEKLEPVQAEQMEQARQDLESGQQDTDCRASPTPEGSACPTPPADSVPEKADRRTPK
jgi:hypothetical protein